MKIRSNRTFMELKFIENDSTSLEANGSNRTFMELKWILKSLALPTLPCSNRTFMELKFENPLNLYIFVGF